MLGTDAGLVPDHGTNLQETGLLVKFGGMTALQAISAGTKVSSDDSILLVSRRAQDQEQPRRLRHLT